METLEPTFENVKETSSTQKALGSTSKQEGMEMIFDIQPIKPVFPKNEKEKRDLELWNAITTAIHLCGLNGEDVTAVGIETLKRLGRYDLLPPCER